MDPWLLYYLLLLEVIGVSDLFLGKRLLSLLRTHRDQPFNDNCTPFLVSGELKFYTPGTFLSLPSLKTRYNGEAMIILAVCYRP